jgi:hypothetical protein
MELDPELGPDAPATPAGNGSGALAIPTGNDKSKIRLLTRESLDGRTRARRQFDQLVASIEDDLGGWRKLTTIERTLIEAYASAAITLENLNAHLLLGEAIDFSQHTQAVSVMVRVASRLGLKRRDNGEPDCFRQPVARRGRRRR